MGNREDPRKYREMWREIKRCGGGGKGGGGGGREGKRGKGEEKRETVEEEGEREGERTGGRKGRREGGKGRGGRFWNLTGFLLFRLQSIKLLYPNSGKVSPPQLNFTRNILTDISRDVSSRRF